MRSINFILWVFLGGLFSAVVAAAAPLNRVEASPQNKACSPVVKITKYKISKGEHAAAVLRKFGLEPVFGNKGSMNDLLKVNNFQNPDVISPGTIITLPFHCEEEVKPYKIIQDEKEFRMVSTEIVKSEPIVLAPPVSAAVAVKPVDKFSEIVAKPADQQIQDVEAAEKSQDNISEALRYRMICEGEWTGSECITRYSAIFANIGGYNNRYDGVDSNALPGAQKDGLLLSKLNLAAGFGWNNYWNENVKTVLYAELQDNQMLPDIKSVPIEGGDRLLTSLQAEARYEKGNWGFGLGFRQFDKLYYVFSFQNLILGSICTVNDVSLCGVRVYSANISSLFFDISYLLYQAGKFRFETELKYFTLAATKVSNVDVQAGSGQSIEFSVTHDRIEEYLKGTLRYAMASQDTSIETQNAKELALFFTYSWKLKDWSEAAIKADKP
ncbi:MAG: LysM domain-containing protein [Pseudobdellovibrio sp.]|nr:LysM domain-containing protein [Pseudobdellovibrio sp.]